VAGGKSLRSIAAGLGRAPSTVSRELAINGGRGGYRACRADRAAQRRARRPKPAKLVCCPRLRLVVEASWSGAGHRSRSRVGWFAPSPTTRRCGCRTRPSTCRCSSSLEARSARSSPATCAVATPPAAPRAIR
jgi:hypothetical protein